MIPSEFVQAGREYASYVGGKIESCAAAERRMVGCHRPDRFFRTERWTMVISGVRVGLTVHVRERYAASLGLWVEVCGDRDCLVADVERRLPGPPPS